MLLAALQRRLTMPLHSVLAMLGAVSKMLVGLGGLAAVGMALASTAARAATLMAASVGSGVAAAEPVEWARSAAAQAPALDSLPLLSGRAGARPASSGAALAGDPAARPAEWRGPPGAV